MANRKTNTAAKPATVAKPAAIVRAATIVAQHGMAGQARAIAATGASAASAKRYPKALAALPAAFAAATFTLTAYGKAVVAAGGVTGATGRPTAIGLAAVALGNAIAANGGNPVSGQALALAVLGNPQLMAAMLATKAGGTHLLPNTATAAGWVAGYGNGLCRAKHGMATKG